VIHRATHSFWAKYEQLDNVTRKLADKNFELLKLAPQHPSFHFKKLSGDLWSIRVGIVYRALALPRKEGFDWFWIGPHHEYDQPINQR